MSLEEKEPMVFLLFLRGQAPLRLFSTVDLMLSWLTQLERCVKNNEWSKPIIFIDDDEEETLIGAYIPCEIQGVMRGIIAPEERIPEMLLKAKRGV